MSNRKTGVTLKESTLRNNIYQSNPLIQARKGMNIIELRLFMLGLRGINPHLSPNDKLYDTEFKEVFIPTAMLTELLGGNTWYLHDLDKMCEKLFEAKIKIRLEDGGWELYHLFRKMKYIPTEGLYIHFEDLLRPYLLDLFKARGYTQIDVNQIFHLTSPYAVRLIEMMLQYQNIPSMKNQQVIERTMTIEEVRFSLNVPDGAYVERMNNFRKFVLDAPIHEINEKTSYKMRYEVLKKGGTGGRVYAFKFFLDTSALPKEELAPLDGSFAIEKLRNLGFNEQSARAIRDKCDNDDDCLKRIIAAKHSLAMKKRRGTIENEMGYLRKYIEENWKSGSSAKSTRRNNQPPPVSEVLAKEAARPAPKPFRLKRSETPSTFARDIPLLESNRTAETSSVESSEPPQSKPSNVRVNVRKPDTKEFKQGEKALSSKVIELIIDAISTGETLQSAQLFLNMSGLTLERFRELYILPDSSAD